MPTEVHITKAKVFLVVMNVCESWIIKKAEHQRIDAFELWCWRRFFESPLDSKDIKPVNPKGNQPWIFIRRTDAEAEAPILWPYDVKSWLTGKDTDAGKDWGQEEKGSIESDTLWPHGVQPARFLCPWASPGKNTGVGCHFLLQRIFQIHGSNPGLLHCRQILYPLSHQGNFPSEGPYSKICDYHELISLGNWKRRNKPT